MRPYHHLLTTVLPLGLLVLPACSSQSSPPPGGSGGNGTGGGNGIGGNVGSSGGGGHVAGTGGGPATGELGGRSGTGGDVSGGAGGTTGGTGCASLALCDDFETSAPNGPPNATRWTMIPTAAGGTATIDTIGAHGSARSLKVVSPDRLYLRNSSVIGTLGPVVHVRFYARFGAALPQGHGAIVVTHPMAVDQYAQQPELRFGSQDAVFHWNTDTDQANIPDVSPNGDAASFKPAVNTWYCVELTINSGNGHLNVSVDGADVPGLAEDGVATANIDQAWVGSAQSLSRYSAFADFNVGWQSYGGGAMTIWFDDVALSAAPIGCQN
jgi:hypothetical protein